MFVFWLAACTSAPAVTPTPPPSETPVLATATTVASCADIDAGWGRNWPAVITALEQLLAAGQSCGPEPLTSKLYAVHYNYGAMLEDSGNHSAAIEHYQAALSLDPNRQEALAALLRLDALPPPTPAACLSTSAPNPDPAPAATPDRAVFVTHSGRQLQLHGQVFKIKGVNYYPRHAPWQRFLAEADPAGMAAELDLIRQAGFNTVRLFLWYEPLFTCEPEAAIPIEAVFAKVDTLLRLVSERHLKAIVTMDDLPDLRFRPLYTDWAHYDAQTRYIVRRYRNEPAILAWDLRNEGDIDYGVQPGNEVLFGQTEVIAWLEHISQLVRQNDPYHLLTAGWWSDPAVTSPYVDFLSFHQFDATDPSQLQARITDYQRRTDQPLLLEEIGYHSWKDALADARDETTQARILGEMITATESTNISGWVVWAALDFVPAPGQPANYEHFFGLWRADLSPKPYRPCRCRSTYSVTVHPMRDCWMPFHIVIAGQSVPAHT